MLLDLGRYVTVRPRKDGTARVLFEVPARLRPSGWSPAIPLPIGGERRGDLTDADEVSRIQADAITMLAKLRAARLGREVESPARSMPVLIRSWQSTQRFKDKKPKTQKGYEYHAGIISDWSASIGHPPVERLKLERIEEFLAFYDDRPTTRRHLKIVLSMLMDRAIQLEWRTSNPLATIKMGAPKSSVTIWERTDVDTQVARAREAGQPSVAAIILTEWEIGQRITDVRRFRHGADYAGGAFRFWQDKTNSWVTIPVSTELQALIEEVRDPDSLYLFTDAATGKPWDEQRLGHVFQDIRGEGCALQLRALRHSCVVQLARSGVDIPGICSITGHSPTAATNILKLYLPRDNVLAWQAQTKRGLIKKVRRTKV
ncbi:MAG: tyrosine-type recombinase/integrase [Caulobacter sp.]|nr:tyrosine-type recombinase/integrase [Caulobacter sp.]